MCKYIQLLFMLFNINTLIVPFGTIILPAVDIVSIKTSLQIRFIIALFPTLDWPTMISLYFFFVISGSTLIKS